MSESPPVTLSTCGTCGRWFLCETELMDHQESVPDHDGQPWGFAEVAAGMDREALARLLLSVLASMATAENDGDRGEIIATTHAALGLPEQADEPDDTEEKPARVRWEPSDVDALSLQPAERTAIRIKLDAAMGAGIVTRYRVGRRLVWMDTWLSVCAELSLDIRRALPDWWRLT